MRAFLVPAGTQVKVIDQGQEWLGSNFKQITLEDDLLFFLEDMIIDPLGYVGCGPQYSSTVGGAYAKAGWYGFTWEERSLLVPMNQVTVG